MSDSSGWDTPGSDVPPGWSPRQPPPRPGEWGPPGPSGPHGPYGGQAPGGPQGSGYPPPPGYGPPQGPGYGPPGWGPYGWGDPHGFGPKPGVIPLRPLGVSEILDGAITYIRQHPKATLGLAAIVTAIAQAIQLIAQIFLRRDVTQLSPEDMRLMTDPVELLNYFSSSLVASGVTAIITGIAMLVLTGMLTSVIGRAVLGRPCSMAEAWAETRPRLLALIGVAVLTFLIVVAAMFLCLVPGLVALLAGAAALAAVLLVLGGIATLLAAVWLYVSFALATPAVVLERLGVVAALQRSFTLVRRDFWRTFGILLLAWLIAFVISLVIEVPFGIAQAGVGALGGTVGGTTILGLVIAALGGVVASTIVQPFSAGVRALLYIDQRMRREGLDITLQRAAGVAPQGASPAPPPAW
ncbi:MAG: hypothetical protein ACRDN9_01635 [Streptosporangiaceae bacterium]